MEEIEFLRELYIQDLEKGVDFYGKGHVRPRVRHIEMWKNAAVQPIMLTEEHTAIDLPIQKPQQTVWFSSDLHFGHKNIIDFSDRPYPNLDLMHECMIANHNEYVAKDDIWICVGDVAFMADSQMNQILEQMNGYKILVLGNHDFNKKKIRKLKFDEVHLLYHFNRFGTDFVCTHYPMDNLPECYFNIHGHLHVGGHCDTGNLQHINVNVEFHNYKPITAQQIAHWADLRKPKMEGFKDVTPL